LQYYAHTMRDRQADILAATIREFIRTGLPVSSAQLYERYDFGIKPASIRIELTNLTDEGFLEQPHHAAGRVPSDAGYAFYAHRAVEDAQPKRSHQSLSDAIADATFEELAEQIAREIGGVSVVSDMRRKAVTRGLSSLVEHLDWDSREELASIVRDIERIDDCIDAFTRRLGGAPQLFIGKQSPFAHHETLAALAAQYSLRGHPVTIITIGPKRMDYDRAASLFATVDHLINQHYLNGRNTD
jgi:transcriptional regulator of heat shock response